MTQKEKKKTTLNLLLEFLQPRLLNYILYVTDCVHEVTF